MSVGLGLYLRYMVEEEGERRKSQVIIPPCTQARRAARARTLDVKGKVQQSNTAHHAVAPAHSSSAPKAEDEQEERSTKFQIPRPSSSTTRRNPGIESRSRAPKQQTGKGCNRIAVRACIPVTGQLTEDIRPGPIPAV